MVMPSAVRHVIVLYMVYNDWLLVKPCNEEGKADTYNVPKEADTYNIPKEADTYNIPKFRHTGQDNFCGMQLIRVSNCIQWHIASFVWSVLKKKWQTKKIQRTFVRQAV